MSPSEDRAESIRHRIRNAVRARGEDVQFGLHRYAAERFLYRLGNSAHRNNFVLKGAMMFALWGGSAYRPTRDLDFTGYGSSEIEGLLAVFRELCAMPDMGDGLVFDGTTLTAEPIREEAEYNGVRVRFDARLGDSRIPMQIDIGFGNAIEPAALDVEYPTLLDHPRPSIRAYPQEAVVAEKLHAMVVLGERNSRYKDFYDLHALALQFAFDGSRLARAISATFDRRSTAFDGTLPAALTPRFFADAARAAQWRGYQMLADLAEVLLRQGKPLEAEPRARASLELRSSATPRQWVYFSSLGMVGEALRQQGRLEEADPLLDEAVLGLRAAPAARRRALPRTLESLALLHESLGRAEEAQATRSELHALGAR